MKGIVILAALLLSGCVHTIVKTEVVPVDKPIPFVPKPPEVPKFKSQVDLLTDADVSDPGKVGQAYKYDMTALRQLIKIYEQILLQYSESSQNFDQINAEIDKIYSTINKK